MRKKRHLPNPYMDEGPSRHGTKSERRIAKDIGARETLGSGNLPFQKGDAYLTTSLNDVSEFDINFMLESKATIHKSISLKKSWLDKVTLEARMKGMEPALTLSFVGEDGTPVDGASEYVMVRMDMFKKLTGVDD